MPLSCDEEFLAKAQRNNRVQMPVLIRWKHKLEAGEVLRVYIYFTQNSGNESFYARMKREGRRTIPKVVVEELGIEPRDMIKVTLYPQTKTIISSTLHASARVLFSQSSRTCYIINSVLMFQTFLNRYVNILTNKLL